MRKWETVDLGIYAKALPLLAKNPVIAVFPLLAALIGIALGFLNGPLFGQLGGFDFGITGLITNLLQGFAFGLAILAAEDAWRSGKARFASTWDEGKRKAGSILLAALGFTFVLFAASLVAGYFGPLGIVLIALVLFFLIYTIPAAAIGGIPGAAALSVSIQKVRGNPLAAAVLCIVALLLYFYLLSLMLPYVVDWTATFAPYVLAAARALVIAYLALVFARQYDEVSFFRRY